jgi:O-antigen/teichoic acid export membrane protein
MRINSPNQIKIGAILSYLSIGINIIAGLIYTPWMVDTIGKSDYGLYTLSNSLITLFLVDFGLSSAVSRYVAKYRAEGRQDKVDNFLGAVYKLYLIIDAVIFVALVIIYFCIDSIYVKLTPAELEKFKVVYLISASFAVINFPFVTFNGILNSYEKFIPLKLADVIYRISLVALTVITLLFGGGLYGLVAVHAIVGLIVIAYKWIVIKKQITLKINWKYSDFLLYKDIFGFSIWVTISSLAQRLVFNITPSILGAVASSAAIAVFGIVTTIEGYTYTITTAINGMFMPKISRIYERGGEKDELMPLMLSVGKFQYAINGLIVAGFAVVGKEFINLWMGPTYLDAYYGILLVIIPGLFFNSMQIANTAMIVRKKVNLQAWVNLGMGIVNVLLSISLSSYFGVIGACISISIAYMLRAVVLLIIYKRVLEIDMASFVINCYFRMGIPIIITIVLGCLINSLLSNGGWLVLAAKGIVIVGIYAVVTLLLGLNSEERNKLLRRKV